MGKVSVEKITEELVSPILENENFELVDIEFKKEGPHKYLRVYIDKPEGITLDDCQKVSEQLSEKLDALDPIEENYFLEISSPGLDRPLKKDSDFEKFKGENVEVKLYEAIDNKKIFEGELIGLEDNKIKINTADIGLVEIPKEKVAITKLAIKF
ncbi:ribosome maturation factor RimP [Clostridium formicaceticum]|uniref:Ribosome maturation factor RimP n=1 Tax=Clostridium formicaceticum TaxID=1497 RepID=A0AAC9RMQ4_9CLOT|nr:ribosome maturation factor RimP [Clostridium formicaceticum]AOY77278.1 ribosome maturation factor RimP [Clostridium formicaceticum]ARE87818.1 Ribosome maturation factor RimP [Clostridium formicaceticum]